MIWRSSGVTGRPIGRPVTTLGDRGKGSAGRRPALPALTVLLALLAIGATTSLLTPPPVAAQAEGESVASPPDEPVEPEAAPTKSPPPNPPTEQAQEPAAEPPVEPPQWNPTATYDAPASAGVPAPEGQSGPPEPVGGDGSAPGPATEEPPQTGGAIGAQNQSTVLQAVWQVQVGCRTYCHGTSQSQLASQESDTAQEATAMARAGESSGAAALNQSTTLQFVWQQQLGCVAFCWDTSMNQSAAQDAQTLQMATAVSDFAALAQNLAHTLQYVWQVQEGCKEECHGVAEWQSLAQHQTTSQSATSTGRSYPTATGWSPDSPDGFFSWVTAFARNIGAIVQLIFQYQEATCLDHCGDEALLQGAIQQAAVEQAATAGDVPEPVDEPPAQAEPPTASGPPSALEPPPASGGQSGPVLAAAAAIGGATRGAADRGGDRWVRERADRPHSGQASGRLSTRSSASAAGTALADPVAGSDKSARPALGTQAADSGRAAEPARAARGSTGDSRPSAESPPSRATDRLYPTTAGDSSDGPAPSWLPAALLLLAGIGVVQSLWLRPRLGR